MRRREEARPDPAEAAALPRDAAGTVDRATPPEPVVVVEDLRKAYGSTVAVDGVSFEVRRGELLGLRWPDVDFEEGQVSIRRTLEESSAGVTLKEPKTARASRTIALPQVTAEALREHRKAQLEMRLRVGPGFNSADLVFPNAIGQSWWPSNFARACRRVFEKAGISCRIHDLRHTHATMLLRQGVHPKVVQERLGHANVGITLDIYSHVSPHMQDEAAEKIDAGMRALPARRAGHGALDSARTLCEHVQQRVKDGRSAVDTW